jgi:hypothetical protein
MGLTRFSFGSFEGRSGSQVDVAQLATIRQCQRADASSSLAEKVALGSVRARPRRSLRALDEPAEVQRGLDFLTSPPPGARRSSPDHCNWDYFVDLVKDELPYIIRQSVVQA